MLRLSLLSSLVHIKFSRSFHQNKTFLNAQNFKRIEKTSCLNDGGKHHSGRLFSCLSPWMLLALAFPLANSDSNDENKSDSTQSTFKKSTVSSPVSDNSTKPPYGTEFDTLVWTLKLAKARALSGRHEEALNLYHKALEELEKRFSLQTQGQVPASQNTEPNSDHVQSTDTQNAQILTQSPNILQSSSPELFIPANLSSYLRARAHIFDEMANVHLSAGSIEDALKLFQQVIGRSYTLNYTHLLIYKYYNHYMARRCATRHRAASQSTRTRCSRCR